MEFNDNVESIFSYIFNTFQTNNFQTTYHMVTLLKNSIVTVEECELHNEEEGDIDEFINKIYEAYERRLRILDDMKKLQEELNDNDLEIDNIKQSFNNTEEEEEVVICVEQTPCNVEPVFKSKERKGKGKLPASLLKAKAK